MVSEPQGKVIWVTDQIRRHAPSTWALGDYPEMAEQLLGAAATAVDAADIHPGQGVLDVGTGTGNAALLAARAGGIVTGVDPAPELLAVAARRAREQNLTVNWHPGTVERIEYPDHTFERVLSVFGAMYAPDPAAAAGELVRCCGTGGRIVCTAWTPDSFMAATNRAVAPYLPPPAPGGIPPTRWGDAEFVRDLFTSRGATVTTTEAAVRFGFPTLDAAAEFWTRTAGHLQAERPRLRSDGTWDSLIADIKTVFADANTDRTGRVQVSSTYLLTVATR